MRLSYVQSADLPILADARAAALALESEAYVTDILQRASALESKEFFDLEVGLEADEGVLDLATESDFTEAYILQSYLTASSSSVSPHELVASFLALPSTGGIAPARVLQALQHVLARHSQVCLFQVWALIAKHGGLASVHESLQSLLSLCDPPTFLALAAAPHSASRLALLADYVAAWSSSSTVSQSIASSLFRALLYPLAHATQFAPAVAVRNLSPSRPFHRKLRLHSLSTYARRLYRC